MESANLATASPRLADVRTFAFALGSDVQRVDRIERLARYDLVVVDGVDAPTALVAELRRRGTIVVGYLSVGTIERGRAWSRAARPYRLDYWGEWYGDVADPGFRELMTTSVVPQVLDRGFDGLFLDNVDMISTHPAQRAPMVELVGDVAAVLHARGGLLFTQNGADVIEPFLPLLDGWNLEDVTSTFDFELERYAAQAPGAVDRAQQTIRRIVGAELFVTTTDYTARGSSALATRAVANACAAGAVPFVSDIDLDRVPRVPPRCP